MSNGQRATQNVTEIALDALAAHPLNSNVMPAEKLDKLAGHIGRTDRYPPIVVRPMSTSHNAYQILDGHHRVAALRQIGRTTARCDVWDVDEAEALVLLATLNRLEGSDDPRKRGRLIEALAEMREMPALAGWLPESGAQLEALVALGRKAPVPQPPRALEQMPVAVHFFLLPDQRRRLEARLAEVGGSREAALMGLVTGGK